MEETYKDPFKPNNSFKYSPSKLSNYKNDKRSKPDNLLDKWKNRLTTSNSELEIIENDDHGRRTKKKIIQPSITLAN